MEEFGEQKKSGMEVSSFCLSRVWNWPSMGSSAKLSEDLKRPAGNMKATHAAHNWRMFRLVYSPPNEAARVFSFSPTNERNKRKTQRRKRCEEFSSVRPPRNKGGRAR